MKKFFGALIVAGCLLTNSAFAEVDPRVEKSVQWAIDIANDQTHGYTQGEVNSTPSRPYTGTREGPDYDCSSLVYHAFQYGGFHIIDKWRNNPKYELRYNGKQKSGDADTIWEDLSKGDKGWRKYGWNDVKDKLQRGDILCLPKVHVAIYIGDGMTVEARGVNNPKGGDWATGDQGGEIDFYSAYERGWTEVYRYVGDN